MNVKYIFLSLIPALFIISSCATKEKNLEGFFNFASDTSNVQKKESLDSAKAVKNEVKQPEATDTPEEVIPDVARTYPVKRYHLGYLTFDVADIFGEFTELEKTPDYSRYRFKFYSHTNGFVDYVFGWMSYTSSTMKVYKNKVVPEKFQTKSILKKKPREIEIAYNSNGQKITYEQVTPPDNRAKRPAVEDSLKTGTFDPLTAAIEARRIVMETVKKPDFQNASKHEFTIPVYDGRKRSDVKFELFSKMKNNLYHLQFYQKALAGYTNNELEDIKKGKKTIDIFLDPRDFWPVYAVGTSPIGSAKAVFVTDCKKDFENCIKREKKK